MRCNKYDTGNVFFYNHLCYRKIRKGQGRH